MEPYVGLTRQKLIKRLEVEEDPDVVGQFLGHPAWQVRWAAIEAWIGSGRRPPSGICWRA